MTGNFQIALSTLERAIDRIKQDVYLKSVKIRIACSHGGITNIAVDWQEAGICSCTMSEKNTDDPNKARVTFHYMLSKIEHKKHSGAMVLELCCQDGRVFNSCIAEEHNNLFSRSMDEPL